MQVVRGRVRARRDGALLPGAAYCNCILGGAWGEWTDHFLRSGVRVHYLNLYHDAGGSRFWRGEGDYGNPRPDDPGLTIDRQAEHILAGRADALFVVRFGTTVPPAWAEANPGHMQTASDGTRFPEASYASARYRRGLRAFFRRVVSYCEARPWGERVIGYMIFPYGEGIMPLSLGGHFYDRSEANRAGWRRWLRQRYGDSAGLRRAWGEPGVGLARVEVPTDAALRAKIDRLRHWPSEAQMAPERDYARYMRAQFEDWMRSIVDGMAAATARRRVLVCIDALKQPLLGWQHNEAFHGSGRGPDTLDMFLSSGSIGVGPLLDLPRLDGLITPADYHARGMGYGFEGEGLSDSMALRRKLLLIENDTRTYLAGESPDGRPPLGAFMDLAEVGAGLSRNTGMVLSRNLHHYWMDIDGGFFDHEDVQRRIRVDRTVLEAGMDWPHRETEHAIAFVIDDEAPLYGNFTTGFHNLAVIRQRLDGLALAGIPYRVFLLSDLERSDLPAYRCYLFPNLFRVDGRVRRLLRRKVFAGGRLAIFGPATGITDGRRVSAAGAEQLLGIPMQLAERTCSRRVRLRDRSLPALRARGLPPWFGDTYPYGPVLVPDPARIDAAGCQVLGDAVFSFYINAAGLVLQEFGRGTSGNGRPGRRGAGDYGVAFCGALPLPPQLLKALARYGGCNVWCERDVVLSASDSVLSVHTTEGQPLRLQLPRRYRRVVDAATGRTVGRDLDRIDLRPRPPQTRVFLLG